MLVEELARQHRERLFRRDGAVSAAAPAREELTWEQRARKAEMDVIRLRQQLQALAQPATSLSQTSAATTKETDASTWAGVLCDQTLLDTGQGAGSPSAASCRPRGDFFFGTPKVQRADDRAASEQMDTQRERDGGWKGVPGPSPPRPRPHPRLPARPLNSPCRNGPCRYHQQGGKPKGKRAVACCRRPLAVVGCTRRLLIAVPPRTSTVNRRASRRQAHGRRPKGRGGGQPHGIWRMRRTVYRGGRRQGQAMEEGVQRGRLRCRRSLSHITARPRLHLPPSRPAR